MSDGSRAGGSDTGGSDGEGDGEHQLETLADDVDTGSMAGSPPKGAHYGRPRGTVGETVRGVVHVSKVPPELQRDSTNRAALSSSTREGDVAQPIPGFNEVPPLNGKCYAYLWIKQQPQALLLLIRFYIRFVD